MDLSTGGDIDRIRKVILEKSSVPVGTVPIYQVMVESGSTGDESMPDKLFNVLRQHCRDGVDFITVHCGVTKEVLSHLDASNRITGIVSRGGSFLARWIRKFGQENPLLTHFDELCQIAKEYDVTLSLGDGLRPGCLHDAGDSAQISEMLILGELCLRAREKGVQVMIEGPGHMPINMIEANVQQEKVVCYGAPYYVLGPLVTDIAPGYDHVVSAMGGAIAASAGADFLCYVTPAEHLKLPDENDVRIGVIMSKIAAHAGDIAKYGKKVSSLDDELSRYRKAFDWEKMLNLSIDPKGAREKRGTKNFDGVECSMCGEFCAMK